MPSRCQSPKDLMISASHSRCKSSSRNQEYSGVGRANAMPSASQGQECCSHSKPSDGSRKQSQGCDGDKERECHQSILEKDSDVQGAAGSLNKNKRSLINISALNGAT